MTVEKDWLERVLAWRASGVTAAEFCEGAPFDASSLRTWSSRLGREGKVPRSPIGRRPKKAEVAPSVRFARVVTRAAEAEPGLVPVAFSGSTSAAPALAVVIGESRIEVCAGFDPSLLRAVVSALGGGAR
jgi:hypothetical protein